MDKEKTRSLIKQKRLSQDEKVRMHKSKAIEGNILNLPELSHENIKDKNIGLFKSFGGEPEIMNVYKNICGLANCFFPVIKGKKLYMQKALKECEFTKGELGILEPVLTDMNFKQMHIILLPGIAFTKKGDRIGFGKGYYDMYLKDYPKDKTPLLIAPIFEFQIVPEIHSKPHDVPADILVTEKRVIKTGAR